MKILSFVLLLITTSVFAQQQHFCAVAKQHAAAQVYNKTASIDQQKLMNEYDVVFHHLDVNVERNSIAISGNVRTVAKITASQLDTFGFELHSNFTIDSVVMSNGTILNTTHEQHFVYALLPTPLMQNGVLDVKIYYHGTAPAAANAAIGAGFSTGASALWGNEATWSLSQPFSAYEWWPCKQSLQDKIDSVKVFITTSNENKAGSQGLLQQVVSLPNNKVRYEWKSNYKIDYYLISVAVAKYVEYNTYAHLNGDSILIQNYIYDNPQTLTTLKPVLDQTASMIEAFSTKFGDYPFAAEKYGHAMAPFSGGMEHQTMTSLGIIQFDIVAHELAHQWFGDHVTCKTWNDIWLNEGFAAYSEYLSLELLNPSQAPATMQQVHTNVMQQPGGSIWFEDSTDVSRIFDSRLTYDKGSAFVHTLRYEVNNDSLFFAFLKSYQHQFAFSTASTTDFKILLEQTTGRDFTQVFAQWFYGEGYPTFNMRWNQVNDTLYIVSKQTTSTTATPLFITPVDILAKRPQGDTILRINYQQQNSNYQIPLIGNITSLKIDPNNWILNQATVVKDATINGLNEDGATSKFIYYFPNPVQQVLTIKSLTVPIESVTVYTVLGKELFTTKSTTINVQQLTNGIYFFVVKTIDGSTQSAQRFIKE